MQTPAKKTHPYFKSRDVLKRALREGSAFALMAALGETYFPAFVLASGLGDISAGLIVTLPLLVGATIQLLTPRYLDTLGSYRRWVLLFTSIQGLALLPLIYFAWHGGISHPMVFLWAMVYSSSGMLAAPAWNTWMTSLIPSRLQPTFFAQRTRRLQMGSLLGFLVGGIVLRSLSSSDAATQLFVPLFIVAVIARFISVFYLWKQPDSPAHEEKDNLKQAHPFLLIQEIKKRTQFGSFVLFLFVFHFAANIAGPFITPWFLDDLKMDYLSYAILVATCHFAKIFTLPYAGRAFKTHSPKRLLIHCTAVVALIPTLLIFSSNFYYLIFVQIVSGIAWAAFELVSLLLLLEYLPRKLRTAFLSYHQFGQTFSVALGSILGGLLLKFGGHSGYLALFALSTLIRGLSLMLLDLRPVGHSKLRMQNSTAQVNEPKKASG